MLKKLSVLFMLSFIFVFTLSFVSFAQEKKEEKKPAKKDSENVKLLKEIAGKYEFEYGPQILVFVISEKDGKLFGAPEGEIQEEFTQDKKDKNKFTAFDPRGRENIFTFIKDKNGKYTKSTIAIKGTEIEVTGVRLKDKK